MTGTQPRSAYEGLDGLEHRRLLAQDTGAVEALAAEVDELEPAGFNQTIVVNLTAVSTSPIASSPTWPRAVGRSSTSPA